MAERESERGDGGIVGVRGCGDDQASVGQASGAGQMVREVPDDGEVVRVDGVEVRVAVFGGCHDVAESVEGEEDGRSLGGFGGRGGEFRP